MFDGHQHITALRIMISWVIRQGTRLGKKPRAVRCFSFDLTYITLASVSVTFSSSALINAMLCFRDFEEYGNCDVILLNTNTNVTQHIRLLTDVWFQILRE